jgi:AcrR family transcriptional regulator
MKKQAVTPLPTNSAATTRKTGRRKTSPARQSLDRDDWVRAALNLLAGEGVTGVRIELLAKRCGVTKGSFYWHFKDRQALLDATLEAWCAGRIRDIEKNTTVAPGKEADQLRHAIDWYGANRNRKGMAIELAIRDWARHDKRAAATVETVDLYRLRCTERLLLAAGTPAADAKSRSLLLYATTFGLSLMHYAPFDDDPGALKAQISAHLVGS